MNGHLLISVGALLFSSVNTVLILHIFKHKNGQVDRLLAALLHTQGETKAAQAVAGPAGLKESRPLPQQRLRQIGLTGR